MYLDKINKVGDIKKISPDHLNILSNEIREFLIEKISHTGGHLGSNLGVVELTMALHLELNLPKDEIIWDVGHQSYTHKLLSGRKDGFDTLRMYGGSPREGRAIATVLIPATAPLRSLQDWVW